MNTFFQKLKQFAGAHKIISGFVVIAVVWGGYLTYAASTQPAAVTKYVVENATQGTVIADVSGSGQVAAETSVDVKPQTSETVSQIYVQSGDHVTAGQVLVQLDTANEQQAVTQAQLGLESAQISLEKLQEVATTSLLQDQSSVTTGQESLINASTSLSKDYQTGFEDTASIFIDLQNIMTNLQNFVGGTQVDKVHDNPAAYVNLMPSYLQASAQPYDTQVTAQYQGALLAYQQAVVSYNATTPTSSPAVLEALLTQTQNTVQTVAAAVTSVNSLLSYVVNNYPTDQGLGALPAITTTYQTNFGNYTNTLNSDLNNITSAITTLTNDQQSLTNDQNSLLQASTSLAELVAGPDPLDVQSQNISIQNAQFSLQTAEQNLAYDTIRAPISGIVSAVDAVVGETVASPAATIVSDGEVADVTLNEIDAAKVALGDPVTLTFDALPNLSLAGSVVELDPVGTVSAGVVNYDIEIGFTQPANTSSSNFVKPGMSVTAEIVTQVDQNVVAIPNAAVHTSSGASYVLEPATPVASSSITASASGGILLPDGTRMVPVTVGLANDTLTEIDSGVNVGDQIITQTIQTTGTTAKTATTGGTSALSALTGGGGARTFGGGGGGGFTGGARAGGGG